MVELLHNIPTNVITGFLGVGKSTAILHLLKCKPSGENWAVLVNEFGKIGIDGAILKEDGVTIKEIPGGCMCCAAGVSVQVGLNTLLARARPDRLLIEPTGIGHPKQIIRQLSQPPFDRVLDMRACITLVDPRHLQNPRYRENEYYREQLEIADVLVANKIDLCSNQEMHAFEQLVEESRPANSGTVSQGRLDPAWLNLPHAQRPQPSFLQTEPAVANVDNGLPDTSLAPGEACRREENRSGEFTSCGWLFDDNRVFDKRALLNLFAAIDAERIKAAVHTEQGDFIINVTTDNLDSVQKSRLNQNRIEFIFRQPTDWNKIETALLSCLRSD